MNSNNATIRIYIQFYKYSLISVIDGYQIDGLTLNKRHVYILIKKGHKNIKFTHEMYLGNS